MKYFLQYKQLFSVWMYVKLIYFCDAQLYFQHHYSSLQCHMIFRNHYIYWFAAQETFIIGVEMVVLLNESVETIIQCLYSEYLDKSNI